MPRKERNGSESKPKPTLGEELQIGAQHPVFTRSGTYYETCPRCNGHPIVLGTYVPRSPIRDDSDWTKVVDYTGGVLPYYREEGRELSTSCDCAIGTWMMKLHGMRRYDSYPGTEKTDTKHSLLVGHYRRLIGQLPPDAQERVRKQIGKVYSKALPELAETELKL
mgnify:CR=1 FL=1